MSEPQYDEDKESALGALIGWGVLGIFAAAFAWYVGAPLIMGERWAQKNDQAIDLVKNTKPAGGETSLYDMIRDYSLTMRGQEVYVGEFSWDALQKMGPEYEVTLLWTEGNKKRVALWRVNLETSDVRPQGNEAQSLPKRIMEAKAKPGAAPKPGG
jgi:hypothetical protein